MSLHSRQLGVEADCFVLRDEVLLLVSGQNDLEPKPQLLLLADFGKQKWKKVGRANQTEKS